MEALQYKAHALLHRTRFEIEVGSQPQDALMILKEGQFFCSFSDDQPFVAVPGDLILFPMKQVFTRKVLEPCKFHLIYFIPSESNPLAYHLPAGLIKLKDQKRVADDIAIFDEYLYDSDFFPEAMKQHALNDLFMMYCRECMPKNSLDNLLSPPVRAVLQYCTEHISEKISLQTMAEVAGMSVTTLSRHIRNETGFSPMEYLIQLRMQKALRDLTGTYDSISEIAERYGYENIYYFSNAFKKTYGISPSVHRKRSPRA